MPVTLPDVVRELSSLPPERFAEVFDFIVRLKSRTGEAIDQRFDWSEQDRQDASLASRAYAAAQIAAEDARG